MELDGKATIALEDGTKLSAEKINGILEVKGQDGKVLPSYYEMWFSWAIWNGETGVVWDPAFVDQAT